jgi:predicted ATPase/class 3 adenylate cyclase
MMEPVRRDLPSGTITFLFTDVEGSTRLVRELGAAGYAQALAEHRRVLRAAFAAHGGVEVDTQGDSFFIAFPTAPGALRAAAAAADGLAVGPIRMRAGIHTGTPHLTEEGYVGVDVHRAARIAACGHGGQVLVSASTASLVGTDGLRDLGEHWLKNMPASERIYQFGEGAFPPLKSLQQANLPFPTTPFLGREKELTEVLGLLSREDIRLLTLTGPGGTGKTRLALQAAAELAPGYAHGVWWVSLAPLRDPGLVLETAAHALGAKDDLAREIADRSMLLLLDNFEQVVEAAAGLAGLLASCPKLDLLVTSREALHVTGEHEYPVPPLVREESVGFFLARARALQPGFAADETISEICRRLDDLPLALELAAARVKALSSGQILARLEQRLPLLTGGPRDVPERQRTLRATIEWSHELLSPEEQRLFARLAVFRGGCTLEGAEDVAGADLDILQSLVDKSLVRHTDDRYWMLETIREYALERFEESRDAGLVCDRHASFFLQLAESAERELTGADQSRWLERLAQEHENLRTALERFLAGGEAELALRLAASLVIFWFVRGHYGEGRAWLDRGLAEPMADESPAFAKALWGAGLLAALSDDHDLAPALLERGLAVARRVGDQSALARCLVVLGLLAFFRDETVEARALFEESIDAARGAGDLWCLADVLGTLGSICPLQGDLEAAEAAGQEALSIARPAGDQQGVRMALFGLALAALRRGEAETVTYLAGEGLAISRDIVDPWFTSYFQWLLAGAALDQSDLASARSAAEEALEIALEIRGTLLVVCAREVLARIEWAQGNQAAAHRQLEDALAASAPGGVPASYVSAVQLTLGRLIGASGNGQTARAHLEASLALATGVGDVWAAERAERALAHLGFSS